MVLRVWHVMVLNLEYLPIKIIATLGPSTMNSEIIYDMMAEGAWGFRLNTSHGNPDEWDRLVDAVLEASEKHGWSPALIADLQGPRVRVSRNNERLIFTEGEKGFVCYEEPRDSKCIVVDNPAIFKVLREGDTVIIGDGAGWFRVKRILGLRAEVEAIVDSIVEAGKGIVVRGKDIPLPPLTDRDEQALGFLKGRPFSHVMVSYVRDANQIRAIRRKLEDLGLSHLNVLAKIETPGGVVNIGEIAVEADGIVVARGDLGMHYPLEEMPIVQARIAYVSVAAHKPVIVATEILASMVEKPVPTRSEITDIFEAVRNGADALLLTAETAIGRHPVKAVSWARRAAHRAFEHIEPPRPEAEEKGEQLALGLVELAESLEASIVIYSRGGRLAKRISSFKPKVPVYVGTPSRHVERTLRITWGVVPLYIEAGDYQEGLERVGKAVAPTIQGGVTVEAAWSREKNVYQIKVRNLAY